MVSFRSDGFAYDSANALLNSAIDTVHPDPPPPEKRAPRSSPQQKPPIGFRQMRPPLVTTRRRTMNANTDNPCSLHCPWPVPGSRRGPDRGAGGGAIPPSACWHRRCRTTALRTARARTSAQPGGDLTYSILDRMRQPLRGDAADTPTQLVQDPTSIPAMAECRPTTSTTGKRTSVKVAGDEKSRHDRLQPAGDRLPAPSPWNGAIPARHERRCQPEVDHEYRHMIPVPRTSH